MAQDLVSVLTETVRTHASAVESWDRAVRDETDDAVHRMRVSARTLRSVVQIYSPCFAPDARSEINGTLRRLGRRLSPARDAEVLHDLLAERVAELPSDLTAVLPRKTIKRLTRTTTKDYASARADLLEAMGSPEHQADLDRLGELAEIETVPLADDLTSAHLDDAGAALAPFVTRRVDEIVSMAKGATAAIEAKERNEQLHELRKEAKRVRYAVTAVRDATGLDLGSDVTERVRIAKKLQRALGDHHDSVMLQRLLLRAARRARKKDENAFGYGILYAREAAVQDKAVAKAERHLARIE